jgi:hypothetical protein
MLLTLAAVTGISVLGETLFWSADYIAWAACCLALGAVIDSWARKRGSVVGHSVRPQQNEGPTAGDPPSSDPLVLFFRSTTCCSCHRDRDGFDGVWKRGIGRTGSNLSTHLSVCLASTEGAAKEGMTRSERSVFLLAGRGCRKRRNTRYICLGVGGSGRGPDAGAAKAWVM